MIKFKQKEFNLWADMTKGATIGAGLGIGAGAFRKSTDPELGENSTKASRLNFKYGYIGALIGAGLGALAAGIKEISRRVNNKTTVNQRLMKDVIEMLKRNNLKEGKDFTRDPKIANNLRTKVCISITRNSGDLKLLINTVSDQKLKNLTEEIIKRIPNTSAVTRNMNDKFNDVSVTSISDGSADSGLICGIAEKFIHSGYPVYLVEVG